MTTNKISWDESVWFSDIDDTLIDTATASVPGSEGIRRALASHCGPEKAAEIQDTFNAFFQLMMSGYRVRRNEDWAAVEGGRQAFDSLLAAVSAAQKQVMADYGHIKKWSREIFIKLAADQAGV